MKGKALHHLKKDARTRCGQALCLDEDSRRGGLTARRNVLFGLWTARRLDLPRCEQNAYAWSVHFADFEEPGDTDVLAKVASDFATCGKSLPAWQVRHQLREMELRAFFQLSVSRTSRRSRCAEPKSANIENRV